MSNQIRRLQAARRRRMTRKGSSAVTYTETEPFALCFYLFNMFDTKSNGRIIEQFDGAIKILIDCANLLDKTSRLTKILKKEVENLEKMGVKFEYNTLVGRTTSVQPDSSRSGHRSQPGTFRLQGVNRGGRLCV